MNKAMVFPIRKKWDDMIFELIKKYEFRSKLPKHLVTGMKIYFYEALGKKLGYQEFNDDGVYGEIATTTQRMINRLGHDEGYAFYRSGYEKYAKAVYEGSGKIVGEATVGEIYAIQEFDKVIFLY